MTLHDLFDVLGDGSAICLQLDIPNNWPRNIYEGTVWDFPYRLMRDYGSCDIWLMYTLTLDQPGKNLHTACLHVRIKSNEEDNE